MCSTSHSNWSVQVKYLLCYRKRVQLYQTPGWCKLPICQGSCNRCLAQGCDKKHTLQIKTSQGKGTSSHRVITGSYRNWRKGGEGWKEGRRVGRRNVSGHVDAVQQRFFTWSLSFFRFSSRQNTSRNQGMTKNTRSLNDPARRGEVTLFPQRLSRHLLTQQMQEHPWQC
jgi:hypothetical protein